MRRLTSLFSICGALGLAPHAQAQALPSAGQWEISVTMEGAPMGGGARKAKACLGGEALAAAPEQALFEAAGRPAAGDRASPRCEFRDVQRSGTSTAWQAQCEGPMGKMQGPGGGTLGTEAADLQQSFTVKAPIGTLNLKQTLTARRLGNC